MYGICTYVWLIFMVNVGKYTMHGCYGYHLHRWTSKFLRFASDFTKIIETVGGFEALIRFLQDTRELKAKALALGEEILKLNFWLVEMGSSWFLGYQFKVNHLL